MRLPLVLALECFFIVLMSGVNYFTHAYDASLASPRNLHMSSSIATSRASSVRLQVGGDFIRIPIASIVDPHASRSQASARPSRAAVVVRAESTVDRRALLGAGIAGRSSFPSLLWVP